MKTFFKIITIALISFYMGISAHAENQYKCAPFSSQHDCKEAFVYFNQKAISGDAEAQYRLGQIYEYGLSIEKNIEQAFKLYEKAAIQNYTKAFSELAYMHLDKDLPYYNLEKAEYWLLKSAKSGNYEYYYSLGKFYDRGGKFTFNAEKSLRFYLLAAEKNKATFYSGYGSGQGGQVIEFRAPQIETLLEIAAEFGNQYAQISLAYNYFRSRNDYFLNHAKKWFIEAAKNYNGEAEYRLGQIALSNLNENKDFVTAYKWFSLSRIHGFTYSDTHGFYSNDTAIKYLEQEMSEQELIEAKKLIKEWITLYPNPLHESKIPDFTSLAQIAYTEFLPKAEKGEAKYQIYIANMNLHGIGTKENFDDAIYWLEKAALQGNIDAQNELATIYYSEIKDPVMAYKWTVYAIKNGFPEKVTNLRRIERALKEKYSPDEITIIKSNSKDFKP